MHSLGDTKCIIYLCVVIRFSRLGMAAHPFYGQLNRENMFFLFPFAPEGWSRETASAVLSRASLLIPRNTQAKFGA